MRYLRNLKPGTLRGKTALVRVDFNVEGKETHRLSLALPTIRFLLSQGSRVVLLSHRGRPKGFELKTSLRTVVPFLKRNLKLPIVFFDHLDFSRIRSSLAASSARVFLLENLRFHPGEKSRDASFARELALLGNLYINDAFSVSHRSEASVVTLARLLPAYAGFLFEAEIEHLSRTLRSSQHPIVTIVGGAKVPEKLNFAASFLKKSKWVLVGGVTANTILKARDMDIGSSTYDKEMLPLARKLAHELKIVLPIDFVSHRGKILDIGPLSIALFSEKIREAKTLIWSGPMGLFEDKRFRLGTDAIGRAIKRSRAYAILGGGETSEVARRLSLSTRTSFISTGGGAMLDFLAKGTLPGIEALH